MGQVRQFNARMMINDEERALVLNGYRLHGPRWALVVNHVIENADPQGPIAQFYTRRNNVQLRRRVRDVINRDIAR